MVAGVFSSSIGKIMATNLPGTDEASTGLYHPTEKVEGFVT
jgi:hypothetical protein